VKSEGRRAADEVTIEDFERYFPYVPTALAIKECIRLAALRPYHCDGPILDVGCGDGLFARLAYGNAEVWGIDINADEGRLAQATQVYSQIVLADITRAFLPPGFFTTCIANCSLEHVPRIDAALRNILGSLKPGGRAFLFVPNRDWAAYLLSVRVLSALGAPSLGRRIQKAVDEVFKHEHLYDEAGWRRLVEAAGFAVDEIVPVGSTASTVAFELFLVPSLAGLLNKTLTTRWTNFPQARRRMAGPVHRAVLAALAVARDPTPTAEFLVIVRRPEGA
jgi:2-polyprenyl-3-methyl-5-hydroxy-6-metoxy-1,4-benzoquinol methylase